MRRHAVLDAPSNLGLRPPGTGLVPGCYKAPGALRDAGLLHALDAEDCGYVTPPRYVPDWEPGAGVRNAAAIASYSCRLADRVGRILDRGLFPVVLGGDCSILLGDLLALRRRGRFGLAFLDGHSDFRHPGNAPAVGAAAGEDLALATGRGDELADLEGRRPLVRDEDTAAIGFRPEDEYRAEVEAAGIVAQAAGEIRIDEVLARLESLDGFWIHLDVDVLDSTLMPAVDSPAPGGLSWEELEHVVGALAASERAVGVEVTIFDPDLDPAGELAERLVRFLAAALRQ